MASSNIGTMPPIAPASAISIPKLPTATTIQLPPINQPIPSNIPSSTTLLKQQPHRQSILKVRKKTCRIANCQQHSFS
jgi:hypothetical protein